MKGTLKYIILVVVSLLTALIFTRFYKVIQFHEAYTLLIALLALFRTCKEKEWVNDKLIQKALECYIEKLEEENKTLKAFIAQIGDAFTCDTNRSDKEIIKDILNTLRVYGNVFNEEHPERVHRAWKGVDNNYS